MMITMRRILHLRRYFPLNSLPVTANNWMLIPSRDPGLADENIRHSKFGIFRNFGTEAEQSMISDTWKQGALSGLSTEVSEATYRCNLERATTGYMLRAIIKLMDVHLLEYKFRFKKHLSIGMLWQDEDSCYELWEAVLEHSTTPLALQLREKLKAADIPYHHFSQVMVEVFFTLENSPNFYWPHLKIEAEDVLNVIKSLRFNNLQYECLKILFSLTDEFGWKI